VNQPDYLDLDPLAVTSAGTRTAGTAADWADWASRSETLLRDAAGGARQTTVADAFETYLSRWNPTLRGLAGRVDGLGTNAVSASQVVDSADRDSATALQAPAGDQQTRSSHLRRPINGPY
jgi:hypothetical protein